MTENVKAIITAYGSGILCSDGFRRALSQKHHFNTTVGDHMLGVAAQAVALCLRFGVTDERTLDNVVKAALCHDLGLIDREKKFRNNVQCLIRHPIDSLAWYETLTGERDERVANAIRCHMFPLKWQAPRYTEGWILTMADKLGSTKEKVGRRPVTAAERDELLRRAAAVRAREEAMP